MSNPFTIICVANQWTLIAQNVTTGIINTLDNRPKYYQTYRKHGDPAPTEFINHVGFRNTLQISDSRGVDVYIYSRKKNGLVRVNL